MSIDGASYSITHRTVGSRRYKVTVKGPGGHSYGAFRLVPIRFTRSARAIAKIAAFDVSTRALQLPVSLVGGSTESAIGSHHDR